jgi:DNA-binding response OmpR family regulator
MKSILVVCHDRPLRLTRLSLLEAAGYRVESVAYDHEAIARLEVEQFDLVLIGRSSSLPQGLKGQRLRKKYPNLLIVRVNRIDQRRSALTSLMADFHPHLMLNTPSAMLVECPQ